VGGRRARGARLRRPSGSGRGRDARQRMDARERRPGPAAVGPHLAGRDRGGVRRPPGPGPRRFARLFARRRPDRDARELTPVTAAAPPGAAVMHHSVEAYFIERARSARRISTLAAGLGAVMLGLLLSTLLPSFHRP